MKKHTSNKNRKTISILAVACVILFCAATALLLLMHYQNEQNAKLAAAAQRLAEQERQAAEEEAAKAAEEAARAAEEAKKAEEERKRQEQLAQATPTPTPTPKITYLTSVEDLPAGTVLKSSEINLDDPDVYFTSREVIENDEIYNRIIGKSYRPNNDISLSQLRYLKLLHYNFDHEIQVGELMVNAELEQDYLDVFKELFKAEYEIRKMHLIDDYWTGEGNATDTVSIEDDNTSAFCYREITSGGSLSNHAFGRAIDLNPLENPYVVFRNGSASCAHRESYQYIYDRSSDMPHVITEEDLAFKLFTEHGFFWGGYWANPVDYQHFEKE